MTIAISLDLVNTGIKSPAIFSNLAVPVSKVHIVTAALLLRYSAETCIQISYQNSMWTHKIQSNGIKNLGNCFNLH